MCGIRWLAAVGLSVLIFTGAGCQGSGSPGGRPRPSLPSPETLIPTAPWRKPLSAQDDHVRRPSSAVLQARDYWETSGDNKIVKAAAATFVGVPVGIVRRGQADHRRGAAGDRDDRW